MSFFDSFKRIFKIKEREELLLKAPKNQYKDLISDEKIDNIIKRIPKGLSKLEIAYFIYIELGKILSEDPRFVLGDIKEKEEHYNDEIDEEYYGICKSISELYVAVLRKAGVNADLTKMHPESVIGHVDTVIKTGKKKYIANLISDLSRIKTQRQVYSFGFDLSREIEDELLYCDRMQYLGRLRSYYGKIDTLSREEIEQLDKKLGYSFSVPGFSKENERGLYTEDVIMRIKEELSDPEKFKKYVLNGKDVQQEDLLKYKLEFIFENINKLIDDNNMEYLERIRWYLNVAKRMLSQNEGRRIDSYVIAPKDDKRKIISILKIRPIKKEDGENVYYLYSQKDGKFIRKSKEELRQLLDGKEKEKLQLVGSFDRFAPGDIELLEL